jgi:hypothetical protein
LTGVNGWFHVKRLARASSSVTSVAPSAGVLGAHGFVVAAIGHVAGALFGGEQLGGDADGARGVRHVDHGAIVLGAILIAVWARLVVAPPISSGCFMPWRCISLATWPFPRATG